MPSKSPAQHKLMEAVAHDAGFARKVGIPQRVGRDFAAADGDTSVAKKPRKRAVERHPRNHAEFEKLGA